MNVERPRLLRPAFAGPLTWVLLALSCAIFPNTAGAAILGVGEAPQDGQVVGGVGSLRLWTFSRGASITRIEFLLDGELVTEMPCCGERADVREQFPDAPLETGSSIPWNWGLVPNGSHTATFRISDSSGDVRDIDASIVVRSLRSEDLGAFIDHVFLGNCRAFPSGPCCGALLWDDGEYRGCTEPVCWTWERGTQRLVGLGVSCDEKLPDYVPLPPPPADLVPPATSVAGASPIVSFIEQPRGGEILSGVRDLALWVFSRSGTIESIEVSIDGVRIATIPCCGPRADVEAQVSGAPLDTGASTAWNWGLVDSGPHVVTFRIRDSSGAEVEQSVDVVVANPQHPSLGPWLDDFVFEGGCGTGTGPLCCHGNVATGRDNRQECDICYSWDRGTQNLVPDSIECEDPEPASDDGSNRRPYGVTYPRSVRVGSTVRLFGSDSFDPEGDVVSHLWELVSAPPGSNAILSGVVEPDAQLTPDVEGVYWVELTVSDDGGSGEPVRAAIEAIPFSPRTPGDLFSNLFDPDEVYILGYTDPYSAGTEGLVHWSDPDVAVVGFAPHADVRRAVIKPTGELLYPEVWESQAREFRCDGCTSWSQGDPYPADPFANDPVIPAPLCDPDRSSGLSIVLSPSGEMLYGCGGEWYSAAYGTWSFFAGRPFSWGHDDYVLTQYEDLHHLPTGETRSVRGLAGGDVQTARVVEGGFRVILERPFEQGTELWRIDAESATARVVGAYPPVPPRIRTYPYSSTIDADGNLLQLGYMPRPPYHDVVVLRTLSGISEVVFETHNDSPYPIRQLRNLVTGP